MTVILVVLCLVVVGLELYLGFGGRWRTADAPDEAARLDERVDSLVAQINERMVPEVNRRLAGHREAIARLEAELAEVRAHLAGRLAQAAAESLGADPVDVVTGTVAGGAEVERAYRRFAGNLGLRVELAVPEDGRTRFFLSGRSPRALERDFFELVRALRNGPEAGPDAGPDAGCADARALLAALRTAESGGARLGPLVLVRTPGSLACGVLTLAELRRHGGDEPGPERLRGLPDGRYCEVRERSR
ncbi:hypothetical protein GCM10009678_68290 [Actinomadura kijaniata]|uniref:Uncharacterized small protein (DUF1192 family) n=1 Tax=Actinomadura namibiensis TaxID=182080 RepID=A0A7W3LM97_ACTNM|nr:hypothetical protein [Actinomadura namibiensis]MBA8950761.1 uncharacterized small protein (DUF1192 family) [Actinomadura namibiensis]